MHVESRPLVIFQRHVRQRRGQSLLLRAHFFPLPLKGPWDPTVETSTGDIHPADISRQLEFLPLQDAKSQIQLFKLFPSLA